MKSEIQHKTDFSRIRYAMCWEDADILIEALTPTGRRCLGIGSAGDNCFSLLAAGASHVTAVEMNPAQIACIKLRSAAYQTLDHTSFKKLLGCEPSSTPERKSIYQSCLPLLNPETTRFWNDHPNQWQHGIATIGKFENYFQLFRTRVLPLAHNKKRIDLLLQPRNRTQRESFYQSTWNNLRWRCIFQIFFSRFVMGRLGRDPAFFTYVQGSVADRILQRTRHALVELDPSQNPYLHMILRGSFGETLPHAWREEHFQKIKSALLDNRLTIIHAPIEAVLNDNTSQPFEAYNLSDIFEYMSPDNTEKILRQITTRSNPAARLAYWNMLAPRSRPDSLSQTIHPLHDLSSQLFAADKAFFYSRFIVEEIQ
jgi:S-adenosylmethionine-diacylglycerol 3-amino-3-carboxypropyl transferase